MMNCLTHGLALVLLLVFSGALFAQGLKPAQFKPAESADELLDQINRAVREQEPVSASPKPTAAPTAGALPGTPSSSSRAVAKPASGRLSYLGLLPGQSSKVDVELLLGDQIETKGDLFIYRPPNEALDAARIEVRYYKESRVLQSLEVVLREPVLYVEIVAHAGRRVLAQKSESGWSWEFFTPTFLALVYVGSPDAPPMFVDRLRYFAPQSLADLFIRRGEKAESEKKFDDAMTEYEKASRIDPAYALPYLKLGIAHERNVAKDKALLYYTAASEAGYPLRSRAEGHFRVGRLYDQDRQYEMALKSFRRAIAQDPAYPEPYFGIGRMHHIQERFDEAVRAYQKAVDLKPDYAVAHDNLGLVQESEKNFRAAAQSYERALQADPKRSATWHRLARVHLRMSEYSKAEQIARRRLDRQADDATAMVQLAMALSSQAPQRAALLALLSEDARLKEALVWLEKGIAGGYGDRGELVRSPFLQQVREQESRSFNNLLERVK